MTSTAPTDTADATAAADRYLAALNETDGGRRRTLIEAAWTPDGALLDPPLAGHGHAGLAEAGDALHAGFPGHAFRRTSAVDAHHDVLRFTWALVDPTGATVLTGTDVATLAADGRVHTVAGFYGEPTVA